MFILTLNVPQDFTRSRRPFWMTSHDQQKAIHYNNVKMEAMASQITSLTIVYSIVYSRRRSKKTLKLCVTGLCEGNSPVTGEFPAQRASNAENISIWWRHHAKIFDNHSDLKGLPYGNKSKIGTTTEMPITHNWIIFADGGCQISQTMPVVIATIWPQLLWPWWCVLILFTYQIT